jgi:two-component system sensor kinase FixL
LNFSPFSPLCSWLERRRYDQTYAALLSLLYTVIGLLWLLMDDLALTVWLGGAAPALLPTVLKNMGIMIATGSLLYGLLCVHIRTTRRTCQQHAEIEEQLRCARDDLENRVQERTTELLAINHALEQQIATRIQMEIALRDSEERFRQLAEHIREVFWVYGIVEERLLYVSPAYEDIWGRPVQSFHERPLDWLEAVHPDDRPRIQEAHIDKHQRGHLDVEYRIVRPDGAIRWIWDRGFPVRDETGFVYRIAGLAEDITARKLAEDQLRRQQVDLARMSRLSLAVELASNLAHELNQPLAAIVAYTQACLTLLRQGRADPRELLGTFEEVMNQGMRASEIIRHLRELVRRHAAMQTPLDINVLIRAVIHYAQLELRQARIDLRLELAESLPKALADDLQVQLVALYLIRNAIEAMQETPEGSRHLTVRTGLSNTDWLLVTVHDTGHGFSPEAAERLFQPFFTTKPGGMGLGLSVSRSIIEAQGGQLWAVPNPEGGVSFYFTLPVHLTIHSPYSDHEFDAHRLSHR